MAKLWLSCGILDVGHSVLEPSRTVSGTPCWLMLAHVGDMLAQGGFKLVPRWLKITLCWLKLASRRPKWLLKASQVPQDEAKMAPRWLPNRYVLASCLFFRDLLPDLRFPMYFGFSGAWKASIFDIFWNKIQQFLDCFWHLGSCMPKEVSRYPHNCCRIAYLRLSGTNLDPSWLQVGSNWAHAGPKLAPTWLKLGPCWAQIRVPCRP